MAITVTSSPDAIAAAYRPMIWIATSDDANIARMFADIFIGGVYKVTLERSPDIGTSNQFTFDAATIMQDFVERDTDGKIDIDMSTSITALGVAPSRETSLPIQITLHEVLDTTAGTFTTTWAENNGGIGGTTPALVTSPNVTLQHTETQNLNAFTVDNSTKLFLTNKPRADFEIRRGDMIQLDFLTTETEVKAFLQQFDADGNFILDETSPLSTSFVRRKARLEYLATGIHSTAKTIKLRILKSDDTTISEQITLKVIDDCDQSLMYFQNPLGGIDWVYFKGERAKSVRAKHRTYRTPIEDGFAITDRGETEIDPQKKIVYELFSGTYSEAFLDFLTEIFASPNVFWHDGTNFVPVLTDRRNSKKITNTEEVITDIKYSFRLSNQPLVQRN